MEDINFIIDTAQEGMDNAITHLEKQLRIIRAGKASPAMLSSVKVDYYGSATILSQVANVNTPDARTITVQPWEKNLLQEIASNGYRRCLSNECTWDDRIKEAIDCLKLERII